MDKFLVHSKGPNWIYFRKDLDSWMRSFTVSFVHDGIVVVTGDYGTLMWSRDYFPKRLDYGFPGNGTGIGYFAEKVCQFGVEQKIREFKKDIVIEMIKEYVKDNVDDNPEYKKSLEEFLEDVSYKEDFEEVEIMKSLQDHFPYYDLEDGVGYTYTEHFKFMYETLISVSEDIVRELGGNDQ